MGERIGLIIVGERIGNGKRFESLARKLRSSLCWQPLTCCPSVRSGPDPVSRLYVFSELIGYVYMITVPPVHDLGGGGGGERLVA